MKISLGHASALALALGLLGGLSTSACAHADAEPLTPVLKDGGEVVLPPNTTETDGGADADVAVPIEAGPRECSTFGFCPTALPPGDPTLKGVWGDGAGVVWAVTLEEKVLRWDGTAWKVHASDLGPLSVIWGSSSTDVWIAGEHGIQHGTGASSAALTFAPVTLPEDNMTVSSIWGTSATDVWAVGFVTDADGFTTYARAYHYGGTEWTLDPVSSEENLTSFTNVWGTPASGLWLVGLRPQVDAYWLFEAVILRKVGAEAEFTVEPLPDDPSASVPYARIQTTFGGAVTDTTAWIFGQTPTNTGSERPGLWKGTSTDGGKTFTWSYLRDGYASDPPLTAVTGNADNALFAVGQAGRVRHWNGSTWAPTAVTTTKFPITEPFYGVWSRGQTEVWAVGKGLALHYDPTKTEDGGTR